MKDTSQIIDLWGLECECAICGSPTSDAKYVPMYEGKIVSDDWPGEWAGMPVCLSCYIKATEEDES